MITECNCDMPLYAYADWLAEQGFEVDCDEFEFALQGFGMYSRDYQWEKDEGGGSSFLGYNNGEAVLERREYYSYDEVLDEFYYFYTAIGNGGPHKVWGYNIPSFLEDEI